MASSPETDLFNRLLEGELSPQDTAALIEWLGKENPDPAVTSLILMQLKQSVAAEQINPEILARLETKLPAILAKGQKETTGRIWFLKTGWLRYAAAAVIIMFFGAGAYLWLQPKTQKPVAVVHIPLKKDIAPGKNGAILTLDDGSSVVLDSLGNGVVATQSGAKVVLQNGQLVYDPTSKLAAQGVSLSYNTMTTPKGRQFELVLPDGTKVWLNAASSIRYPTVFAGNERKVEMTGEAYFEVTKNPKMPFRVKLNDKTAIEVLGTHFNINSYTNEASINTTLLEGAVQVFNGDEKALLRPGQQARIDGQLSGKASAHIKIVTDVNVDKVMAWKNGVFNFQDATLHEVMRQLERWYDIDVVYEKGVPEPEFMGTMQRDLSLSDVLSGLKLSEVHFRIEEGRKLVITP